MNFILKLPSLQQMIEVKIVSELWHQFYVETYNVETYESYDYQKAEKAVIEKIAILPIPTKLRQNFEHLVNPLGLEIRKWLCYHRSSVVANKFVDFEEYPSRFSWTPHGTVDNKQTAELMVNDENVNIEQRYKLACVYCMEKEIPILWQRISEERQPKFHFFRSSLLPVFRIYSNFGRIDNPLLEFLNVGHLVTFWTCTTVGSTLITKLRKIIRDEYERDDISPEQFGLDTAVFGANKSAIKYFFEKFSREGHVLDMPYQVRKLLNIGKYEFYSGKSEALFFMLNQLNEEEREKVLGSYIVQVLECLLHWPYQSFFIEAAKKWFRYLNKYKYIQLLDLIYKRIEKNKNDYYARELFPEFFQLACSAYADFLPFSLQNLILLYVFKEENVVKEVLSRMSDCQKSLLMSEEEQDFFIFLINGKRCHFVSFMLSECCETSKEFVLNL